MNWELFDEQWRRRYEYATLAVLTEILAYAVPDTSAEEFAWRWRCARLLHFEGMLADEESDASAGQVASLFISGAEHAKRAVEISKHGVEGQFWLGVNALEAGRRKGALAAGAALSSASKNIERAMKISEEYHFAGPVRVWGRIQHLKPLILGGSLDRAHECFRRALQISPDNSTTLLYYAEALWADRQPKPARELCEKIISAPNDPNWIWEQARDRRLAAKLLEEINRSRDT